MCAPVKRNLFKKLYDRIRSSRLDRLKNRLFWNEQELTLKNNMRKNSHSILWVWEFSKKAVLICFTIYIVIQLYAMISMIVYNDFTHLGELISLSGEIVRDCVFAYFIKAGVENVFKIRQSSDECGSDEHVG